MHPDDVGSGPHFSPIQVREAIRVGVVVPGRVRRHLARHGWDKRHVCRRIEGLSARDFHKSQIHRDRPDVWLDIYRPYVDGVRIYIKFTIAEDGEQLLLLSFCLDGERH